MEGYYENYLITICPKCGGIDGIHKEHTNTAECCLCETRPIAVELTDKQYFFLTPDERKEYDAHIREKHTLHSDVFDEELYKQTLEGDFERRLEIETEKREMQASQGDNNQPHCPICNSTKIHKISGANKVGAVALFGVFSIGHVGKTFKCDSCGAKF